MMAEAFVPIEEKHGDDCTCRSVGEIRLDLVAVSRTCPGDRNPHRAGSLAQQLEPFEPLTYPGRIAITWPAADPRGFTLQPWAMQIHDYDSGEPLLAVTGLSIVLGGDAWNSKVITADLKMFVDADGAPLTGAPAIPIPDPDDASKMYARVFRCHVAEMRTAPTEESVVRGEHGPNDLRRHRGINGARPSLAVLDEANRIAITEG